MTTLDNEIRAVEARLARTRSNLGALVTEEAECARDAIASPQCLLGVAAIGFLLGDALHRSRRPQQRRGLIAKLAPAALALLPARYGSPLALAQRVWSATRRNRTTRGEAPGRAEFS
jgi:hypothetical protein